MFLLAKAESNIAFTHISLANTQSSDCPNFREARRCSLAVNLKGRGNASSEQLVSATPTKSCDSLQPIHKEQAEAIPRTCFWT